MHVQNLKLFQNLAIYYKHHHGNDVIILADLFLGNFQNKHFLISKRSCYVTDNPLIDCFRKVYTSSLGCFENNE